MMVYIVAYLFNMVVLVDPCLVRWHDNAAHSLNIEQKREKERQSDRKKKFEKPLMVYSAVQQQIS